MFKNNSTLYLAVGSSNGFQLLVDSHNNSLRGDRADDNALFGYEDESAGLRTSGTANNYRGNECSDNGFGGSNPNGLCRAH
jgi:hypothetical protein